MRSKNINMFLMDGTPTGLIKCTIGNWIGIVYKIPKSELERCKKDKNRDDLKQSGVYFLFGASNETGKPVAYIGQAGNRKNGEGILNRLLEHKRNADKDYWTYAVAVITANNSFGPTEISFLENKFCTLAIDANRYEIKNGNDPSAGHITEEKESEMEQFIENARLIMWALNENIFEPVKDAPAILPNEDNLFYLTRKIKSINFTVNAVCKKNDEGFVVLKGSKISPLVKDSVSIGIKKLRASAKIDSNYILLDDISFLSPSGAAEFVIGNNANGWEYWKNKDGVELRFCKGENADD